MKLKLILVCLLALIIGGNLHAQSNESLALDGDLATAQESNEMTWPMLPGESLNDVARMFYPKNLVMQRLFVSKTLYLNSNTQPKLGATNRFKEPTLLVIPTLKALSKTTHTVQAQHKTPGKHKLQISYSIEEMLLTAPTKLKEEYQFWLSKNEILQQQLGILKEKIAFLEKKLNNLTLIWEKTLNQPTGDVAANNTSNQVANAPDKNSNDATSASNAAATNATIEPISNQAAINASNNMPNSAETTPAGKKVFKNLNASATQKPVPTSSANLVAPKVKAAQDLNGLLDYINSDWAKIGLALGLLAIIGVYLLKKYRERMFAKMSFVATKMHTSIQESLVDLSGYLKPKTPAAEETPEAKLEAQAAKEVTARLDSTLAEAKLLMSMNRHQDAIAHLKQTIEAQPKVSINHWLYLLEIFRKLNLKDDFEAHAKSLHDTYNVMTPVWYETEISMYVPQTLEEFPHIIEKLCKVWPGILATVYLRGLITDNRGGDRAGFGKAVLNEILMLLAVLDIYAELN